MGEKPDIERFRALKRKYHGLQGELCRRLDLTRHGLYWMLQEGYGTTRKAREKVARFNELLPALEKEFSDAASARRQEQIAKKFLSKYRNKEGGKEPSN